MMKCPNCGRENADNFNFCLDCGYDLKAYRESQAHAPAPPVSAPAPAAESLGAGVPTEPVMATATAAAPPAPAHAVIAPPAPVAASAVAAAPAPTPTPPAHAGAAAETVCPSCQSKVPSGMKFCGSCGKRLDGGAEEPAAGRTMFMHAADLSMVKEPLCKLVTIDQAGKEGMTFTLKAGETICGRVNGIILFFDDPYVSPTHCLFSFQAGRLKVTDKQSLNGVYVRLKEERVLDDGDHLRIGRQLFRFEALSQASSQVSRADGDDARIWGSPTPGAFGRLVQILEDGRTGEIRLLRGEVCNLGRELGEIVFPTDGFISGRHCSFYKKGEQVFLKDVGSSNGTYVRIRGDATLVHGDFLLVGNQMLRVEIV